jgi:hypothetical protein
VREAQEVPVEMLSQIFHRVVSKPMKLQVAADKLRNRSRKQLKKLMERTEDQAIPFVTKELYLLVIDRLWSILFAAMSLAASAASDPAILGLSLSYIELLAFFLSSFSMSQEFDTVISFLCTACCNSPGKEIAGITAVARIAKENGNGLGESWLQILELFSKLMKSETLEAVPVHEIESVYRESTMLDRTAFLRFVFIICQVSMGELLESPPSLFSLQKIIEIAECNLNRVRFIWSLG